MQAPVIQAQCSPWIFHCILNAQRITGMNWIRTVAALSLFVWLLSLAAAQSPRSIQAICDAARPAEHTAMQFQAPDDVLADDIDYRAILCTTAGAVYVDLFESLTPVTVNNFVFLAKEGYYDSTTFHRVIPDFMAQAGDPTATGRGGPGYQFGDEPVGFLTFDRPGLLAMANAGPGTNGSQFFITTAATPHLNHRHTIFGDVLLGQENVLAIRERDPQTAAEPGETLQTVVIVTDPAAVDNTGIVELEPATQADVITAFAAFTDSLPPELLLHPEDSGLSTTEEILKALPADLQEDFAAFADAYGHQYRYSTRILNSECNPEMFFSSIGYQVDVFEGREAAAAAWRDNFTKDLIMSQGFSQPVEYEYWNMDKTFLQEATTCADEQGFHLLLLYTRGRYLVTIDSLVDTGVLEQALGNLLSNLANQIEIAFASVYASEIR